jgi:hypothetical protein
MHRRSVGFFLSPADVGIEKYRSVDIAELMKPVDPVKDDDLLLFAQAVSALLEEPSGETVSAHEATCSK